MPAVYENFVNYIKANCDEIDKGHFLNNYRMRELVIPTSEIFTAYQSPLEVLENFLYIFDIAMEGVTNIVRALCAVVVDFVEFFNELISGTAFKNNSAYKAEHGSRDRPKHTIANIVILIDAVFMLASRVVWQVCAIVAKLLSIFLPEIIRKPLQKTANYVQDTINTFFKLGREYMAFDITPVSSLNPNSSNSSNG